jgi:hypothetical protein
VPFPGTYIVDRSGIVVSKFFEEDHRERNTAANLAIRALGPNAAIQGTEIETPHLLLRYSASDKVVYPGSLVLLSIEVELKPGMHVYAPGVTGYKPIAWTSPDSPGWLARPVAYPASHLLHLPVIDEIVPVYEGRFRLTRDLLIGLPDETRPVLQEGSTLRIEDVFSYQACDERTCYAPQKLNLRWDLTLSDHDRNRAPVEFRKK